ncbi:hypothetical protein K2173_006207 [Erythroxylum novogranatense]|uniref:rRNA adenine N(6)-methyltransferase n=1 Tax=Erythroxylum novogranatense TaxID=1862640 RepID=A0AAV8TC73_9ROSI|nr:hypothetical protein K2173_006207 [Erythroxylum novogranatense]
MSCSVKEYVFTQPKCLIFKLFHCNFRPCFVHGLRTKASSSFSNSYQRDHGEKTRGEKEGQEGILYLHKSKGQHLLTNPRVLDTIVQKSAIRPTDTVLEIGPGTGNLTTRLLEVARKVVAVEIDRRMVDVLHRRVSERGLQDRLSVVCEDALKAKFPQFDLVVANIPYGISSPLIAKLVYGVNSFRSATLLLQKEFARRLLAKPGDSEFNRLAANVKLVAEVEFVMNVSKRDFVPCPKVDSSVIKIHPKAEIPIVNLDEWAGFTRTCFSKKNKTLGATFKQKKKIIELLGLSKMKGSSNSECIASTSYYDRHHDESDEEESDVEDRFSSSGFNSELKLFKEKILQILEANGYSDKRPSKLSNDEFLNLLSLFNEEGIHFHDYTKPRKIQTVDLAAA